MGVHRRDRTIAVAPRFGEALSYSEGLAVVWIKDRWGYIDKNGEFEIVPRFNGADPFSEGLASAYCTSCCGSKKMFIDKRGNPESVAL